MTTTGAGRSEFEEWWADYKESVEYNDEHYGSHEDIAHAGWSACETAMNREAGWAANEAEKVARRKVAVDKLLYATYSGLPSEVAAQLDAIIAKAQG